MRPSRLRIGSRHSLALAESAALLALGIQGRGGSWRRPRPCGVPHQRVGNQTPERSTLLLCESASLPRQQSPGLAEQVG